MSRLPVPRLSAVALVLLAVTAAACSSGGPSATPTDLLHTSTSAAEATGSVHFAEVTRQGSTTQSLVGALSAPAAWETLVTGGSRFEVRLTGGVVYVRGPAAVLESALGLSRTAATANAGNWISVQSGDAPYSPVVQALSLEGELDPYVPGEPGLHQGATVHVHGHAATPVTGTPSVTVSQGNAGVVTLFVATESPHLPLGGTLVLQKGKVRASRVVAYTNWGKPVTVSAPSGAVPYSSIANS
jgi:hypothetical protein